MKILTILSIVAGPIVLLGILSYLYISWRRNSSTRENEHGIGSDFR